MIADIITVSRIVFSLLLFVIKPNSVPFTAFYLLCGISDALDGFIARKLHTESERGAMLDSAADLVFALFYALRILPLLAVPLWAWLCAGVIAVIKIVCIIIVSKKTKKLSIEHSVGNKLTGVLLFLLPLSVYIADVKYGAAAVCVAASAAVIKEIINIKNRGYKMILETKRIKIYPASEKQMKALIAAQTVDVLKAAYTEMLDGALAHPDRWAWYAIWMIELTDGTHIGELCFKGIDADGSTEIGYGISEAYQGHGYATEAVNAVTDWALKQDEINRVTAEVETENTASVRVLEKSGFVPTGAFGEEGAIYRKISMKA